MQFCDPRQTKGESASMKVQMLDRYGPMPEGGICSVLREGRDWYYVRYASRLLYIGKHLARPYYESEASDVDDDYDFLEDWDD